LLSDNCDTHSVSNDTSEEEEEEEMNNENVVVDSDETNVPVSEQDSYDRSTTSDIVHNEPSIKDDIGEEPEDNNSWKETSSRSDSCPYHLRRHPNLF